MNAHKPEIMKMMPEFRNALFSLLILLPFGSHAQAQLNYNFLKGYYVNMNSDTIHGYVEYRSLAVMNRSIRFKEDFDSEPIRLRPGTTRSVVLENKNFFDAFSYTPTNGLPVTGFFKKIIKGHADLYEYDNQRFFVKKEGGEFVEITKKKMPTDDSKMAIDYYGLGMLRTLMADCPAIDESFLSNEYKGITNYRKIVTTYNRCFPEGSIEFPDIVIPVH